MYISGAREWSIYYIMGRKENAKREERELFHNGDRGRERTRVCVADVELGNEGYEHARSHEGGMT